MRSNLIAIVGDEHGSISRVEALLAMMYGSEMIKLFYSMTDSVNQLVGQNFGVIVLWISNKSYLTQDYQVELLSQTTPVLAICQNDDPEIPSRLVKVGVKGLMRYESINELARGVRKVKSGESFICQIMLKTLIGDIRNKSVESILSKREMEILRLLSKGNTYLEISDDLFISFDTTKSHVYNIYKKLNARNKSEAVYKARKKRILM